MTRHFAFIKHSQKVSGYPVKSILSFGIYEGTETESEGDKLDRKFLLIGNPDVLCLCLIKAKCLAPSALPDQGENKDEKRP